MITALASGLFAAAWKGSLLAALALLFQKFARNRFPAPWMAGLLLVAILRLLLPVAPSAPFSVFNLLPGEKSSPVAPVVIAGEATPRASAIGAVPRAVPTPSPTTLPWLAALIAVWAAGAVFFLGRALSRTVRFHRDLSDSRDVDLSPLIDECRSALRVRRRVRVVTTDAVATPSLHGWLRPALLLPTDFLHSFSREQLRYVVLHELAHLRRSDVLVNWMATAAQVLHWFNPLVHLAIAKMAEECELACDAVALKALRADERPAYGGTVVDIVDRLRTAHPVPALVGMTATPHQLKRRILMIATFRQSSRSSILFAMLVMVLGLVTLTDASAGEGRVFKKRIAHDMSPATHALMEKLDQRVTTSLTSASIEDVLHAISNATGVTLNAADGVITDEARKARFTLTATDVPAHLIAMEALSSVDLGLKFTETGAEVVAAEGHHRMHMKHSDGHPGEVEEHVILKRRGDPAEAGELPPPVALEEGDGMKKRVEVRATAEVKDGVTKKKLTVETYDGKAPGTLELEVVK